MVYDSHRMDHGGNANKELVAIGGVLPSREILSGTRREFFARPVRRRWSDAFAVSLALLVHALMIAGVFWFRAPADRGPLPISVDIVTKPTQDPRSSPPDLPVLKDPPRRAPEPRRKPEPSPRVPSRPARSARSSSTEKAQTPNRNVLNFPPASRTLPSSSRQPSSVPRVPDMQNPGPGTFRPIPTDWRFDPVAPSAGDPSGPSGPMPQVADLGTRPVGVNVENPNEYELEPDGKGNLVYKGPSFEALVQRDGSVVFRDQGPVGYEMGKGAVFDPTDLLNRALGNDPFLAARRRFLKKTQAQRDAMRKEANAEQEQKEQRRLAARFQAIWNQDSPPEQRRRQLFLLWMERGDEPAPSLSARARAQIEQLIRQELPEGSAHAFTTEEIFKYNQKLSGDGFGVMFRPYP